MPTSFQAIETCGRCGRDEVIKYDDRDSIEAHEQGMANFFIDLKPAVSSHEADVRSMLCAECTRQALEWFAEPQQKLLSKAVVDRAALSSAEKKEPR